MSKLLLISLVILISMTISCKKELFNESELQKVATKGRKQKEKFKVKNIIVGGKNKKEDLKENEVVFVDDLIDLDVSVSEKEKIEVGAESEAETNVECLFSTDTKVLSVIEAERKPKVAFHIPEMHVLELKGKAHKVKPRGRNKSEPDVTVGMLVDLSIDGQKEANASSFQPVELHRTMSNADYSSYHRRGILGLKEETKSKKGLLAEIKELELKNAALQDVNEILEKTLEVKKTEKEALKEELQSLERK